MEKNCLKVLLIVALINFASCDHVDNNSINMEDVKIAAIQDEPASTTNVYALSASDIVQEADLYKEMLSEDQGVISDVKYTIKKIDRRISAGNVMRSASRKEDVPLYNVDYTSEMGTKGFLLLVGDNRVKNRVIAYSDNSSFNENALDDNGVLMDLIDNYIQRSIQEVENNGEDKVSTYAVSSPICFTKGKMTLLNDYLDWNQFTAPANSLTPLCNGTSHAPAGCAALAGAQIMAYHGWPRRGCYSKRASLSSGTYSTVTVNQYTYGQKNGQYMNSLTPDNTISNLCAELGYRCNVVYGCDVSNANLWGTLPQAFLSMGYYAITTNSYGEAKIQTIANEVDNGRPVFMIAARANEKGETVGHAWVVDGVMDSNSPDCAKIHIVYGNGTYNNGWYHNSIFKDLDASSFPYVLYSYIAYNIRPNPSNPGATSTAKL